MKTHHDAARLISGLAHFLDILLRGYTPLILWNHPAVGAAFGLALFLFDPWAGAAGLLGNTTATAMAIHGLKIRPEVTRYGIFGANGFYTGLAWTSQVKAIPLLLPLLVAAAALSALLTARLFKSLTMGRGLPVLMLPFMLACWFTLPLARLFPWTSMEPWLHASPWPQLEQAAMLRLPATLTDFSRGLSCLLFQDGLFLGLGIFTAWLLRTRLPVLAAFSVALAAPKALDGMGGSWQWCGAGIWAMTNGVLTAFALGGTFLLPTFPAFAAALLGGMGAAWLTHMALPLFSWLQLPIFVAPFVAVTLLLLLLCNIAPPGLNLPRIGLIPVPLAQVGAPKEKFSKDVRAV